MGNIIPGIIVLLIVSLIVFSMVKKYKRTGTTCTSCTSCPKVETCNKDTVKAEMLSYLKKTII